MSPILFLKKQSLIPTSRISIINWNSHCNQVTHSQRNKDCHYGCDGAQGEPEDYLTLNLNTMNTFKESVATLIKNGAVKVDNVEVISASLSKRGQYDAINLITKDVYPSYTKDKDEAEYSKKDTHCISVLLNIATNAMMHCDNVSLLRDYCRRHPGALAILLSNSKLNLISQEVSEGQTYQSINLDGVVDREWEEDYSQILYNIVDFVKIDDKIFDKLLDKALSE